MDVQRIYHRIVGVYKGGGGGGEILRVQRLNKINGKSQRIYVGYNEIILPFMNVTKLNSDMTILSIRNLKLPIPGYICKHPLRAPHLKLTLVFFTRFIKKITISFQITSSLYSEVALLVCVHQRKQHHFHPCKSLFTITIVSISNN